MNQLGPLFPFSFKADSGPSGLKIFKVAARGNLPVFLLSGHPDLDIIGLGSGKTQIPSTQLHDLIWQLKAFKNVFSIL